MPPGRTNTGPVVAAGSGAGAHLTAPRRYQLRKSALAVLASGHPWLFRNQMSSAAEVFADGQWLRLVDGANQVVGHGIYEAEGALFVRILERGPRRPDGAWVAERVAHALERRAALRQRTDAFRALHGENDGVPAVVLDVFGAVGVLQTYSRGADALGRLAAVHAARALDLDAVVWKPTQRRRDRQSGPPRLVRGSAPPARMRVREDGLALTVDVMAGQKTGAFLDLRGLRRWIAGQDLGGARVLNLFSYTATLALAARHAGAAEVWNVDSSRAALAFGEQHHGAAGDRFIAADIFAWLPRLGRHELFDLVIVDPPLMTSRAADVPRVLATYRRLFRDAAAHLAPGGRIVACCCTARVSRDRLRAALDAALGPRLTMREHLAPEPDHPVSFAEGEYLKILIYG